MSQATHESPDYIFSRSFRSSFRLNHNHWLVKSLCGYLLHPKIPAPNVNARIADVGAGTGIWLFEVAERLPETVQLYGFDISPEQYPPPAWWPKNVDLVIQDAFKPFPVEHHGIYDIVHARFFLCLVNDDSAALLLENLVSLLKPGGYLQWLEPDATGVKVRQDNPAASTVFVEQLARMFRKPTTASSFNWLSEMSALFERQGLTVVARDTYPVKNHLLLPWAQSNLAGYEELMSKTQIAGSTEQMEAAQVINGLSKEFRSGVGLDTTWLCFVGQKTS